MSENLVVFAINSPGMSDERTRRFPSLKSATAAAAAAVCSQECDVATVCNSKLIPIRKFTIGGTHSQHPTAN